jgi:hypothetical protein
MVSAFAPPKDAAIRGVKARHFASGDIYSPLPLRERGRGRGGSFANTVTVPPNLNQQAPKPWR